MGDNGTWWASTISAISSGWDSWNKNKTAQNNANQTASLVSGVVTIALTIVGGLFVISLFKRR